MNYKYQDRSHQGHSSIARTIAYNILGKSLPPEAEVHHIDGDTANNNRTNIIICENKRYHHLLHTRTKAYLACGNANKRICWICQEYDLIKNLQPYKEERFYHNKCRNEYRKYPNIILYRESRIE
jgi:hypothetical protein